MEAKEAKKETKAKREKILSQIGQLFLNREESARQLQIIDQKIGKLKLQLFKNG